MATMLIYDTSIGRLGLRFHGDVSFGFFILEEVSKMIGNPDEFDASIKMVKRIFAPGKLPIHDFSKVKNAEKGFAEIFMLNKQDNEDFESRKKNKKKKLRKLDRDKKKRGGVRIFLNQTEKTFTLAFDKNVNHLGFEIIDTMVVLASNGIGDIDCASGEFIELLALIKKMAGYNKETFVREISSPIVRYIN